MTNERSTVGVVGLGAAGQGFIRLFAKGGARVVAVDSDTVMVRRVSGLTEDDADVTVTDRLEAVSSADLVVVAVSENVDLTGAVLRRLHELCPPETVLAVTTLSSSVSALAVVSGRPQSTVGLRVMAPPPFGRRPQVLRTAMSSKTAVELVIRLLAQSGEEDPVTVDEGRSADGAARELVLAFLNRAVDLWASGYATPADIDTAMRLGCGLPTGPLELLDAIGLDTAERELRVLHERTGDPSHRPADQLSSLVADGFLGLKTGRGVYGGRDAVGAALTQNAAGRARQIRTIGVVGSGTMARGVAQVAAVGGYEVVLVARGAEKGEAALSAVSAALDKQVGRGRLAAEDRDATLRRLRARSGFDALADCDLVVEAAAELIEVKRSIFGELDRVCKPGAVLATTTSSLSVTACAEATSRPEDVVGMHFFNPAPVMRLVELVGTEYTGDDALATARAVAVQLRKTPVLCADRSGFIVNFLLFPYLNDAVKAVQRAELGIEEIDEAITRVFGYPMGPFALLDTIGLDISEAIQLRLHESQGDPEVKPAAMLTRLVELGRLGRKTGSGFLDHSR